MILYMAHPVAPPLAWRPNFDDMSRDEIVASHISNAKRWIRWLWNNLREDHAICAPWIPMVEMVPDDGAEDRERGIAHSVAMSAMCDGIVLVGGRISSGMARELAEHQRPKMRECRVIDLTHLGSDPASVPAAFRLPAPWGRP